MKHHDLFNDKSKLYESSRPTYPDELYKHLSDLCSSKEKAWDCACGNGQAAENLSSIFDKVVATDISEQQIKNAKNINNVEFSVSLAENTEFPDNSFDLICVAQALHWFNFETFWPEIKRVLKPNGIFSAWGYTLPTISDELDSILQESIYDVIEPYWAPQNKLLWDHYEDVDFPFVKINSPNFTMEVDSNLNEFSDFIHTFSATRLCMKEQGDRFFEVAFDAISQIWGDIEQKKTISLGFTFYAGRMKT
ncbi:MAG: class I SAM-dependent methyltransferase [Endozoicomonas sp.]